MDTIVHASSLQFTLEHRKKVCYAIIAREEYEARAFRMERPFFAGEIKEAGFNQPLYVLNHSAFAVSELLLLIFGVSCN